MNREFAMPPVGHCFVLGFVLAACRGLMGMLSRAALWVAATRLPSNAGPADARATRQGLSPRDREYFIGAWNRCQQHFLEDPEGAVYEAGRLARDVMEASGRGIGTLEKAPASHYETAHRIMERHRRGRAGPQDLRAAMPHYRIVLSGLLEIERERKEAHQ